MKAVILTKYGSSEVLKLEEIERPIPGADEVLVRVRAVSLNDWDIAGMHGADLVNRLIFGLANPRIQILGSDIAGLVEAVGRNVRSLKPGDEVFGDLNGKWGGLAEFVCTRENALSLKPAAMSFEQAAAVPQAATLALQGLESLRERAPGQTLLINGAGGGVGTFGIQIARMYGAEITAVDRGEKLDFLRSLGAEQVLDYRTTDFTASGRMYDLILDVKTDRPIARYMHALRPGGSYVTVGGSMARLLQGFLLQPWFRMSQGKTARVVALKTNGGLDEMKALFETGKVLPVIEGGWSLENFLPAVQRFEQGLHVGKIVISVK